MIDLSCTSRPQGLHEKPLRFFYAVGSHTRGTSPPGSPRGSLHEGRENSRCEALAP